ncbi:MAG: PilZ domain-containing protein [Deltaproteobacteria bacterium]|jgi:c-di-GMP-binding flagellar brake protein YcgR|nr:PilZ domain-containing protein [Deltaproteobacteria bacterium]
MEIFFIFVWLVVKKKIVNEEDSYYMRCGISTTEDEMVQGVERRKFARLDLALTISYKVLGHSSEHSVDPREGISSDISVGGIRLMTPTKLENGTMLELEIILGEDQKQLVHAEGEVMWQNKISSTSYETGVQIKGMPSDDKSKFMQFVFDQMAKVVT